MTTGALLGGVTEQLVRGAYVEKEQGQINRNIQGKVKQKKTDQGNIEAYDFVNQCHSVFLL